MDDQNKFNQAVATELALLIGKQTMELIKMQVQLQFLAEAAKKESTDPEPGK